MTTYIYLINKTEAWTDVGLFCTFALEKLETQKCVNWE